MTLTFAGSVILLEVCGEGSVGTCHRLLLGEGEGGVSAGAVYISPSPEQGKIDSQALNTVIEISLTM